MLRLPYHRQKTDAWCGPASLQMVLENLGTRISQRTLAAWACTSDAHGTERMGMRRAVRKAGHSPKVRRSVSLSDVARELRNGTPVIVNYVQEGEGHFSVIVGLTSSAVLFNGPYYGRGYRVPRREFLREWNRRDRWMMTVS